MIYEVHMQRMLCVCASPKVSLMYGRMKMSKIVNVNATTITSKTPLIEMDGQSYWKSGLAP